MGDTDARRVRAVVHGMVQGVGFRWSMQHEAQRLGIGGTVRNRFDGAVEAEIEGPSEAVAAMLRWLEHGPPSAAVSRIDRAERDPRGESTFRITG